MIWSRPLDPAEAFFARLDRISSMNFVVRVDCDEIIDPALLRAALDRMQREDRLLAVAIKEVDQQLVFEWYPGRAIPIELLGKPRDQWDRVAEKQLSSSFQTRGFASHAEVRNVSLAITPARNQACSTMVSTFNGRPDVAVICDEANLRPGLREQLVRSQQRVLDRAVQACREVSR